jgi:SRSO17 transposase
VVVRAVCERVVPAIEVEAWVLDDTGFPKDGKQSPGVKRQYSGTLGKIGNCQIGVSVHAVGSKGTVPLGWALYLPKDWCDDPERRRRAKIPVEVVFQTKPELGVELIERAAGWEIAPAPVLGDCAYGDKTELRGRLDAAGREYVLSVSPDTTVFAPHTVFGVPDPRQRGRQGRQKTRPRADQKPEAIGALIAGLDGGQWQTVTFRDGPDGEPMTSRFCFLRVRAGNDWEKATPFPPREEWLIAEWPDGREQPTDYWLSNLPADTEPERLARLARLRWKIELDYKQLKGELGLDHYEGRSWLGWYHHTALVTAAHGFLTLERQHPNHQRPA